MQRQEWVLGFGGSDHDFSAALLHGTDIAADPFMLIVASATPECRRVAPAVVHVDGTSRVQVVGRDGDPFLIRLLSAFGDETGVPMLPNTSFNRRGEPLVETPEDAVAAFLEMGLDGLWMDGLFLYRPL